MRSLRRSLCLTLALTTGLIGLSIGTANATAKPKQAVASVVIGTATTSINSNLPLYVGQADGYYSAKGLSVKILLLTAATTTSALLSNSVQLLASSASVFLQARATNVPIEAVEAVALGLPAGLILSTQFAASKGITAKTPLATVAKDMIGSTGGSSAISTTGQVYLFLEQYGVQPSQVTVATLSSVTADEAALEKNQINWFSTSAPVPQQVQAEGFGIVVATPKNTPAWNPRKEGLGTILVGSESFINANPGLVKKIVSANEAAVKEISQHELKVLDIAQANYAGISRPILLKAYSLIGWPLTGKMNVNQWRSTVAFQTKISSIARNSHVTEGVDWTNKFA